MKRFLQILLIVFLGIAAIAAVPQGDKSRQQQDDKNRQQQQEGKSRWRIAKTSPVEVADLDSSALDLKMPDNIRQQVEYNDSLNLYFIGS